jgi:hypothetical protein
MAVDAARQLRRRIRSIGAGPATTDDTTVPTRVRVSRMDGTSSPHENGETAPDLRAFNKVKEFPAMELLKAECKNNRDLRTTSLRRSITPTRASGQRFARN